MAGSGNRSDTEVGCAALLGILGVAVVCWLLWTAVTWAVAEWHWAWIIGCALAVPCLAYGIVWAWGEPRPFVPFRQAEAWITAFVTALVAAAPVIVLVKGWLTAVVALLFALGSAVAVACAPWWAAEPPAASANSEDDAEPPVAASTEAG
jgi:hypothetical protein